MSRDGVLGQQRERQRAALGEDRLDAVGGHPAQVAGVGSDLVQPATMPVGLTVEADPGVDPEPAVGDGTHDVMAGVDHQPGEGAPAAGEVEHGGPLRR